VIIVIVVFAANSVVRGRFDCFGALNFGTKIPGRVHEVGLVLIFRGHRLETCAVVVVLARENLQRQPIAKLRWPLHAQLVQYRRFDQLDVQRLHSTIGAVVNVLLTVGGGDRRKHRFHGDQQQNGCDSDDHHIRHFPTHQRSSDYRSEVRGLLFHPLFSSEMQSFVLQHKTYVCVTTCMLNSKPNSLQGYPTFLSIMVTPFGGRSPTPADHVVFRPLYLSPCYEHYRVWQKSVYQKMAIFFIPYLLSGVYYG